MNPRLGSKGRKQTGKLHPQEKSEPTLPEGAQPIFEVLDIGDANLDDDVEVVVEREDERLVVLHRVVREVPGVLDLLLQVHDLALLLGQVLGQPVDLPFLRIDLLLQLPIRLVVTSFRLCKTGRSRPGNQLSEKTERFIWSLPWTV